MGKEKSEYRFTVFKPGTPQRVKVRGVVFFVLLAVILFVQAFYYLFANQVKPFVIGLPFSMFFIVLFIVLEFVVLLVLYLLEQKGEKKGGES
jgi:phosphoglycerol transferase MdoB-like AlkP superfamily enzyme